MERLVTELAPIQRLSLIGIAVLGALVAASALPGLWIGAMGREAWGVGPQFLIAGFEAVTLLSGLTAVVVGLRARMEGIGLAVLCVGGAVAVGAVLGAKMLQSSSDQVPSLMGVVKLRLGLVAGLVGLVGVVKIGMRGDCWRTLAIGGALLLPLGYVAYLVVSKETKKITDRVERLPELGQMVAWVALAVVLGALTVAGGHFLIRAFEKTREPKAAGAEAE